MALKNVAPGEGEATLRPELPGQDSNLDYHDPESCVLPITPPGNEFKPFSACPLPTEVFNGNDFFSFPQCVRPPCHYRSIRRRRGEILRTAGAMPHD